MPGKGRAAAGFAVVAVIGTALGAASASGARETGRTIHVRAGDDLQAAIDRARGGDTLLLEAGATFEGNYVLPPHDGDEYVTIRSSAADRDLPPAGVRIDPSYAPRLPKLRSPTSDPVMATRPGARHWRLALLELQGNRDGRGDILRIGDGPRSQRRPSDVPHHVVVDRCYVHGDDRRGQKNGIALHGAHASVQDSYIAQIASTSQESHGIIGWNGPGPFRIVNNLIEASGINVMFGGADPGLDGLVPADIEISGNHIRKRPEWREPIEREGRARRWLVKNLLELKSARRVTIDGNLLEYNWVGAGDQPGYAVLMRSENPGAAPWSVVQSVRFVNNLVRHAPGGISIVGVDGERPAEPARDITIANNLWVDIDPAAWRVGDRKSNARFASIVEVHDVTFDANTIDNAGPLLHTAGGPSRGFRFTNNIAVHGKYGVKGDGTAPGTATLERYFPGAVFTGNVIAGGRRRAYPAGNRFPSMAEHAAGFADAEAGDFSLAPRSAYRQSGLDGGPAGARIERICLERCASGRSAPAASP